MKASGLRNAHGSFGALVYLSIFGFLAASALVVCFFYKPGIFWSKTVLNQTPNPTLHLYHNQKSVLIFSKTNGFRHHSIEPAIAAITKECVSNGWEVFATEDAAYIDSTHLRNFKVVIFLSTTGEILNNQQKTAFENYIENGGGFAGIHSASDTEHDWPWYGSLLGTFFRDHTFLPHIPEAELITENIAHPINRGLPRQWRKADEWYNFQQNVRGKPGFQVLLSLNENSYRSVWRKMNGDHPISWTHELRRGRMFYTALGHNVQTYSDPNALRHIMGGIRWAGQLP
ncbi:ThuA domain-containing protein [Dyadobacter chenwenxiniae]|uniref:ThuA domain-containing protein n=1 Tax=Dyadobacter chenwenxiniae TaxID=2906456 RepID=A0A9X1PPW0_9BACT|nr:ThuA domain-containing protein [Dyadobacter chenwenxiniae]MCF0062646.1 ThuA domain-containing protein [Dyadobacter chenwenxiniae]UON83610.1 ThuA domain-containing protein [Dyadobacter chenwenxiniae]